MNAIEHDLSKTLREHAEKNDDPVRALMINASNTLDEISVELSIVRADEREACARVIESWPTMDVWRKAGAAAIRARSSSPTSSAVSPPIQRDDTALYAGVAFLMCALANGDLSEGQVASALQTDRVSVRKTLESVRMYGLQVFKDLRSEDKKNV